MSNPLSTRRIASWTNADKSIWRIWATLTKLEPLVSISMYEWRNFSVLYNKVVLIDFVCFDFDCVCISSIMRTTNWLLSAKIEYFHVESWLVTEFDFWWTINCRILKIKQMLTWWCNIFKFQNQLTIIFSINETQFLDFFETLFSGFDLTLSSLCIFSTYVSVIVLLMCLPSLSSPFIFPFVWCNSINPQIISKIINKLAILYYTHTLNI